MRWAALTHVDVSWTKLTNEGARSLLQSRPTDWPELTVKYGQDEVMMGTLAEAEAH